MANYQYINTQGQMQTVQADNPNQALTNAPNIAPNSGVQLQNNPVLDTNTLQGNGNQFQLPQGGQQAPVNPSLSALNQPQQGQSQTNAPLSSTTTNSAILDRLGAAQAKLRGQGDKQLQLEQQADLTGQQKKINDLTLALTESSNRFQQAQENFRQGQVGTQELSTGKQAQVQRNAAISLSGQSAVINTLRGNLDAAKADIDHAIKLEFEPVKQEIDNLIQFKQVHDNDLTEKEKMLLGQKISQENARYEQGLALATYREKSKIDAQTTGLGYAPTAPSTYTVKSSDIGGLYQIAQQAGVDFEELKRLNPQLFRSPAGNTNKNYEVKKGDVINLPTANLANNQQAVNTILASGKFTKDQKADLVRGINSGEDPFTILKNQAKNIMGQTEATKVSNYEIAKSTMNDISSLLTQYYANGGDTGIFKGNYEKTLNKLGEVNNPQLVSIATQIAAALQVYRNSVSGTAYSVQEGRDIASIFPGINNSKGLNQAIISGRSQAFDSVIDAAYRNTLGSSYDQFKGTPQNTQTLFNGITLPTSSGSYGFGGVILQIP